MYSLDELIDKKQKAPTLDELIAEKERVTLESEQPITLREGIKRTKVLDVLGKVPVPFNPWQGYQKWHYLEAKKRLAEGDYTKYAQAKYGMTPMGGYTMTQGKYTKDGDFAVVKEFEDWQKEVGERGQTWQYQVGGGIRDIMPWIADIAVSGGVRKSVTKTLDSAIKSRTLAKGAGLIANSLVATSLQPSRYTDTLAQVKIDDPELSEKEANVKAIKRLYIMNLSEMTGEFITKGAVRGIGFVANKLPFTGKLLTKLSPIWQKITGGTAAQYAQKISTATGVNSMFGEVGEERVETTLMAITNADDFGAGKDAGMLERLKAGWTQDAQGIGVELAVLAAPVSARYAASRMLGADGGRQQKIGPEEETRMQRLQEDYEQIRREGGPLQMQKLRERLEAERQIDEAQEREIAEMDAELAEIQRPARQAPVSAPKPTTVEETPAPEQMPTLEEVIARPDEAAEAEKLRKPLPEQEVIAEKEKYTKPEVSPAGEGEVDKLDKLQEMIKKHPGTLAVAVKLDSGEIICDSKVGNHGELLDKYNLDLNKVADGGFVVGGKYISSITDAKRPSPEVIAREQAPVSPAGEGEVKPAKKIEPIEAFETRDYKSVKEFKDKGEFLEYIEPQLKERPHPYTGGKTVRPYVVGYGCDGSTDANIHYVAQKMARLLGIDYADTYKKAYAWQPERTDDSWVEKDLGDLTDEAYKSKKVKNTTIIPHNATIQDVLDDLYDINNRSLVAELENRIEEKGISFDTKLKDLQAPTPAEPAKAIKQMVEEKPAVEETTDEELSGISNRRRNRLIKETEKQIAESDIYQAELEGMDVTARQVDVGYYYVPKNLRAEVEDIIGKRKGFPTSLQRMFTFEPDKEATEWTKAVQEGLGRGKEGVDQAWGEMDITEFVQRVKEAHEAAEEKGLSQKALERISGDPYLDYLISKRDMLKEGYSPAEIDDMTRAWAEEYGMDEADIENEFIGPEPQRIKDIKKLPEQEQDAAIEALARENVLKQERQEAKQAVNEVLTANDIEVEVEEVDEIGLPEKPEDAIPFERRGRPVGAAIITPAGREIVQLAYGADSETGYHEGYHILRGHLTPKDVRVLDKHFKGDAEAEARAFAAYAKTGNAKVGYLKGIWRKLVEKLKKIKSALQGRGYRMAQDIFGEIKTGKVAKGEKAVGPTQYERGVFDQPIQEQLRLPFKERQVAIKRVAVQEAKAEIAKRKGKPYEEWRPKGVVPIKLKLIKAVDAEIARTMKPRSNTVNTDPERIAQKITFLEPELFYKSSYTSRLAEVTEAFNQLVKGGPLFQLETSGDRMIRESMRNARIKAEKERLKTKITPKARRGRLPITIHDYTPVLSEEMGKQPGARAQPRPETFKPKTAPEATAFLRDDLEPAKLPPAKPIEELDKRVATPKLTQKWFDENVGKEPLRIMSRVSRGTKEIADDMARAIWSSSTRLENIHPELMRRMREYCYRWMKRTSYMLEDAEPFLKKFKKLRGTNFNDWKALDLALKNSQKWKAEEIVAKHGMVEEYAVVKGLYDEIADMWDQVGGDLKRRADYWHREIKDSKGFLKHFYNTEHWSAIEQALKSRARKSGRDVADLTDEEKAQVINTLLRGYRTQAVTLATPGAVKERLVPEVDKAIDGYYYDSGVSLVRYIREMNQSISQREFFGRETHLINKLRAQQSRRLSRLIKLKKRQGLKSGTTEPKYKEHISKTAEEWKAGQERLERLRSRDLTQTIGGYVGKLKDQGLLSAEQERSAQKIISGILQPKGMRKKTGIFATGVYLDTLNSFFQALTQLDEYAYSVIISPRHAIPAGIRTIARKNPVTLRDLGITAPGVEFEDKSLKKSLSTLLTATGFRGIDVFGKETLINTALPKYEAEARRKTLKPKFVADMKRAFGPEYKEVIEDLKRGEITENVNYLLFNVLADRQPIAHSEMPEMYNTGGNARILYTLKTFYLKRLDFVRKECWDDMKSPKTFHKGFAKLLWIVGSFAALGAGSDALKDFLKGRAFKFADSVWNNMLSFIMWSKYSQYKAETEGYVRTAAEKLIPPTKVFDAASRDVVNLAKGKDRGFELWRSVPMVGEPYYWWFGEGMRKEQRKRDKEMGEIE